MECRYSRVPLYSSEPRSSVSKVEAISLISPASASVSTVTRSALSSLAREPFRCLLDRDTNGISRPCVSQVVLELVPPKLC